MKDKYAVIRLGVLLSLTLLLTFLPGDLAQADPPDPPPSTPVWRRLDFHYPPPEAPFPLTSISAQGTLKTFYAVADTEVRQSSPSQNYGIEPAMAAGYDNYLEYSLIQRALLRFNVSAFLPPGTAIHQATLRVYLLDSGYCDVGPGTFRAYRIAGDWSELATTWNSQPSFAEGYGSTTIPVPPSLTWVNFDVTDLVRAWVSGDYPEYGLMIRGPETTHPCAFRTFLTKGGGGFTSAPELVVDYTAPPPTLAVSQNDVVFFHQCGTPAPEPSVIAVQSNDTTLNDWTASVTGGDSWLGVNKTSGKVSQIFPDQIEISVTETTSCPETVTAQIQISAPNLGGSPQTINITLQQSSDEPAHVLYLPLVTKNHDTSPNSSTSTADRIALIISVADYLYLEPPASFSVLRSGVWGDDLLGPRSDGFATQQALLADYDTKVVLSEEHATKANIDYALEWIDEREGPGTAVLIDFSVHGGPIVDVPPLDEADGLDELLGIHDTNDEPQFVSYLLDDNFKTQLANLETEHLAVIIDACNSGGMEVTHPHRAVLAASREDQSSWETSEFEHGVFTYYMLQAMLDPASDTNGDGWLSVQEIYNYAGPRVADYVRNNTSAEQNPTLDLTRDFNVVRMSSTAAGQ